jgi:putative tryptophan/tyrosine transport system substrate-binding protein
MRDLDRRGVIGLLGGAAAWPVVARAQQPAERMRRVGVLLPAVSDDREFQARLRAFLRGLQQLGWIDGRNVRMDMRWGADDGELRRHSEELVALGPDVLMAFTSAAVPPLRRVTRTVPIVFAVVTDPVGAGFVESLGRPGANVTGFTAFEFALSGKWLELLKEIAPRIVRVGVLRDSGIAAGPAQFGAIQAVAPSHGVELRPIDVHDSGEIDRSISAFAGSASGLIVTGSAAATAHRELIVTLAARHRLPTVYYARYYVEGGGLISYGPDFLDQCNRAAAYVDRILKGENPADLPVQAPTKFEVVINLKAAKAIGLDVPPTLLARADEVIE